MSGRKPDGKMAGYCDHCGKWSCDLKSSGLYFMIPVVLCPECEEHIRIRIRRKYRVAGEHTEPAE